MKTRCQSVSGRPRTAARASETPWAGRPRWAVAIFSHSDGIRMRQREKELGALLPVAPPKVSQRRAQLCTMSFSMRCLALGDRTRALAAHRKSCQVAQNQTWAASIGADVTDDAWEGLQTPRLILPYKSYMRRCSSTSSHPYIICVTPHTCHDTDAHRGTSGHRHSRHEHDIAQSSHTGSRCDESTHSSGTRATAGRKAAEGGHMALGHRWHCETHTHRTASTQAALRVDF